MSISIEILLHMEVLNGNRGDSASFRQTIQTFGDQLYNTDGLRTIIAESKLYSEARLQALPETTYPPTLLPAQGIEVWPNPVRESAQIAFELEAAGSVTVSIHHLAGQRLQTVYATAFLDAGPQQVTWDAGRMAAGVYLVVVEGDGMRGVHRVVKGW